MSGDLHDISAAIGRLQEAADNAVRVQSAIFRKLEEMQRDVAKIQTLADAVERIEPEVEKQKKARLRQQGWAAAAGAIAGGVIVAIKTLFGGQQ